jgi:hypothetical protein
MSIKLNDFMPFGKYKGQSVEYILASDPGYLCWLREDKKKSDTIAGTRLFSVATNATIDAAILASPNLSRKYKAWNLTQADVPKAISRQVKIIEDLVAANAGREISYADSWGSF